jgi:hypothetical protein
MVNVWQHDSGLHSGASGSGGPPGERNGQFRHGERTKATINMQIVINRLVRSLLH